MMEAATRAMCPQAKEGPEFLATPKADRGREQTSLTALRRNPPCQPLDFGLLASRPCGGTFALFELPSSCSCVTAAPGDEQGDFP